MNNKNSSDPILDIDDLYNKPEGLLIMSGSINGLFGKLFNKGRFDEIINVYKKLSTIYKEKFYIEIQRHDDLNEKEFEKFNLQQSLKIKIPIIATNETFYLNKEMCEAHDALICIGSKTYINEKNRLKYSVRVFMKLCQLLVKLN